MHYGRLLLIFKWDFISLHSHLVSPCPYSHDSLNCSSITAFFKGRTHLSFFLFSLCISFSLCPLSSSVSLFLFVSLVSLSLWVSFFKLLPNCFHLLLFYNHIYVYKLKMTLKVYRFSTVICFPNRMLLKLLPLE